MRRRIITRVVEGKAMLEATGTVDERTAVRMADEQRRREIAAERQRMLSLQEARARYDEEKANDQRLHDHQQHTFGDMDDDSHYVIDQIAAAAEANAMMEQRTRARADAAATAAATRSSTSTPPQHLYHHHHSNIGSVGSGMYHHNDHGGNDGDDYDHDGASTLMGDQLANVMHQLTIDDDNRRMILDGGITEKGPRSYLINSSSAPSLRPL
jgi:hypothetical protein